VRYTVGFMTPDECIAWVEGRIATFMPEEEMDQGDIATRLPQIMAAAATIGDGVAFGYKFPPDIRDESIAGASPRIHDALEFWRGWLSDRQGDEGRAFFRQVARAQGLSQPEPKALRSEPAIAEALEKLRERLITGSGATDAWRKQGWVEETEAHGWAIAPPAPDRGERLAEHEIDHHPLPAELEALYDLMDGLWTGAVEPPGGEQPFDPGADAFVFAPLERVLQHAGDRDDGLIVFNQHPDFLRWTMIDPSDGAILVATKLDDGPPARFAASLADFLLALAESYGRMH
jgi:hypothetical protein